METSNAQLKEELTEEFRRMAISADAWNDHLDSSVSKCLKLIPAKTLRHWAHMFGDGNLEDENAIFMSELLYQLSSYGKK